MKNWLYFSVIAMLVLLFLPFAYSQSPLLLDFSKNSLAENGLSAQGAGFGQYPLADIQFGAIPTNNAFPEATDGQGMIVKAEPGEGAMIFAPKVQSKSMVFFRCSVRADTPFVSIYLAAIDQGEHVFVTTITANQQGYFFNRYRRMACFFIPPSSGCMPLIQILNAEGEEPVTVYVDNFEIYTLDPDQYYSPQFLDGDETDPDVISISRNEAPTATPTEVEPTATPEPQALPDLIVSNFYTDRTSSNPFGDVFVVVVKNQGNADAGPFSVQAESVTWTVESLQVGASVTLRSTEGGVGYNPQRTVVADSLNQVHESDETNNSLSAAFDIWPTPVPSPTPPLQPSPTPTLPANPTPTPTQMGASTNIVETEPNDTVEQMQDLGTLKLDGTMIITGNCSKGGRTANGGYSGDSDGFKFTLAEAGEVSLDLQWNSQADLDVFVFDKDGVLLDQENTTQKPLHLSGYLQAGLYGVLVVSKDNPSDYQLTITAKKSDAPYPSTPSLLNGKYYQLYASLLWYYEFDGEGSYRYVGWTSLSGEVTLHSGTYTIAYPYLTLNHSDGTVEKFELRFISDTVFILDEKDQYEKNG